MKLRLLFISIFILVTSCQFFETDKVTAEKFYEEEVKEINWSEVDRYPVIASCGETPSVEEQKTCFEQTVANHLLHDIELHKMTTLNELDKTVLIEFSISEKAKLSIDTIKIDSLVIAEIPHLKEWLQISTASIPVTAPAYKRGIPVKTSFKLPVKIKTSDL